MLANGGAGQSNANNSGAQNDPLSNAGQSSLRANSVGGKTKAQIA